MYVPPLWENASVFMGPLCELSVWRSVDGTDVAVAGMLLASDWDVEFLLGHS